MYEITVILSEVLKKSSASTSNLRQQQTSGASQNATLHSQVTLVPGELRGEPVLPRRELLRVQLHATAVQDFADGRRDHVLLEVGPRVLPDGQTEPEDLGVLAEDLLRDVDLQEVYPLVLFLFQFQTDGLDGDFLEDLEKIDVHFRQRTRL